VAELGADTDPFMLHLYAALAEKERALISRRTKDALAAAKGVACVWAGPGQGAWRSAERAERLRLAQARWSMRRGLISLLGTLWRSNQDELDACRCELAEAMERERATSQVRPRHHQQFRQLTSSPYSKPSSQTRRGCARPARTGVILIRINLRRGQPR
jgi:DNA invertase Pin-like site-specific DNA recombinase